MEIGLSTACFYPMNIEDAVAAVCRLGFSCAEIFINTDSELEHGFLEKAASVFNAGGVRVHSLHPFTSQMETFYFFSAYRRRQSDGIKLYRRYFEAMRILGADYLTFHGGKKLTGMPAEEYARRIMPLVEEADRYGKKIAQENVFDCLCADPEYISDLIRYTDGALKFTFDVKQANKAGVPPFEAADAMGQEIATVHINDYDAEHTCMLPGTGCFDTEKLVKKLAAGRIAAPLVLEVYRSNYKDETDIIKAKKFLVSITNKSA